MTRRTSIKNTLGFIKSHMMSNLIELAAKDYEQQFLAFGSIPANLPGIWTEIVRSFDLDADQQEQVKILLKDKGYTV